MLIKSTAPCGQLWLNNLHPNFQFLPVTSLPCPNGPSHTFPQSSSQGFLQGSSNSTPHHFPKHYKHHFCYQASCWGLILKVYLETNTRGNMVISFSSSLFQMNSKEVRKNGRQNVESRWWDSKGSVFSSFIFVCHEPVLLV